jgi:cardiolipin-specific phospholipase
LVSIGTDTFINTLVIKQPETYTKRKNLVIAHGYGAGLGFFFRNYAALTKSGYNIYSIDWLGMANSR